MTLYCTECGRKHDYATKKPNFCGGCGYPFNPSGRTLEAKVQPVLPQEESDPDDDDDLTDEIKHVPNVKGLDVEIEGSSPKKETVGSLFSTAPMPLDREPAPKVNRKKFLEDFKKEAGTLRPKS